MNKKNFIQDKDVCNFVEWLANQSLSIKIHLHIKKSKYVPDGVSACVEGFQQILNCYQWKSTNMITGNWQESLVKLESLSQQLRNAVSTNEEQQALRACIDILNWGGDKDPRQGSRPFLVTKASNEILIEYLCNAARAMDLDNADTTRLASVNSPVEKMNSMLTKIHALLSEDGLPIYDSRVAAASAALVEKWRRDTKKNNEPLPNALRFPATLRSRTVRHAFDTEHTPGVFNYLNPKTSGEWAAAKVRLAWLMQLVLNSQPLLFADSVSQAARMHAFEATLFMIGYDVSCLNANHN
jgi:hypothetical protein